MTLLYVFLRVPPGELVLLMRDVGVAAEGLHAVEEPRSEGPKTRRSGCYVALF